MRLAIAESALHELVRILNQHCLFGASTLAAIMAECGRRRDFSAFQSAIASDCDLLQALVAKSAESSQAFMFKDVGGQGWALAGSIFDACPWKTACLCSALVDVCVSRDMVPAKKMMQQAVDLGAVDVLTYHALNRAHLQYKDVQAALTALSGMRAAGMTPSAVTLTRFWARKSLR